MTPIEIIDVANKITTAGVLGLLLWGIKEKWLVPGWIFTACEEKSQRLEAAADERANKLEAKLNSLEEKERQRWEEMRSHAHH